MGPIPTRVAGRGVSALPGVFTKTDLDRHLLWFNCFCLIDWPSSILTYAASQLCPTKTIYNLEQKSNKKIFDSKVENLKFIVKRLESETYMINYITLIWKTI